MCFPPSLQNKHSLPSAKYNCKQQLMREEAPLWILRSFNSKGFRSPQTERDTLENIPRLSYLNNKTLAVCAASVSAAAGVAAVRLNAGCSTIGRPGPPHHLGPVERFQPLYVSSEEHIGSPAGCNGDALQYSYKLLQVCVRARAGVCVSDPLSGRGSPSHFL